MSGEGLRVAATLVGGIYLAIGVVHSIILEFVVSRADCAADPHGLIYMFCNTGVGISHLVIVLGWPLYWFQ